MRHFLFTLLLAFGMSAFAASLNTLRVVPVSGQEVLFHVDGKPQLAVNGTTLVITVSNQDEPAVFEIDNISHVDLVNGTEQAVSEIGKDAPMEITRQGRTLKVAGIPDNSDIRVFTTDGRQVIAMRAAGEAEIDFSKLPAAFYIVKINQVSIKTRI